MRIDFIRSLTAYFAGFVSPKTRKEMFRAPKVKQTAEYREIEKQVLETDESNVIEGISDLIVSINNRYVSERLKNSKGYVLFVEYGNVMIDDNGYGVQRADISISVSCDFSDNADAIDEAVRMERCYSILDRIISRMRAEQQDLNWNPLLTQIEFPASIYTIEPTAFYGRGGWVAMFKREDAE